MLEIYTGEQLINEGADEILTLVDPILPKVGIAGLAGSSDTGKSTLLQQLAFSIVAGEKDFVGFPINPEHNNVIYVSTEDDPDAISVRLTKQIKDKYTPNQFEGLRFIFGYDYLMEDLDTELTRQKADCVIIDAFADVFGDSDMNQVGKVRKFLDGFKSLAKKHQCLFLILHHIGKRTEALAPSKDSLIGSHGFEAKMRVVLFLKKDPDDSTLRHLSIVKGNYLPSSLKKKTFILRFDDNLLFTNTNNRMDVSTLSRKKQGVTQKEWIPRAVTLKEDSMPLREIEEQLLKEGFKNCGRTAISEALKKYYEARQEIDFEELNRLSDEELGYPDADLDYLIDKNDDEQGYDDDVDLEHLIGK